MIRLNYFLYRILIVFLFSIFLLTGCKGSDTREAVDETVEDLAGKEQVEQMKKMEDDVGKLQEQQSDRFKNLDEMEEE